MLGGNCILLNMSHLSLLLLFMSLFLAIDARLDMTVIGGPARITNTTTNQAVNIHCYDVITADPDIEQQFGRSSDTGTGSGLPTDFTATDNANFLGKYLTLPEDSGVERVGDFFCDTSTTDERNDGTRIELMMMAENAEIVSVKKSFTINPGESVTLQMQIVEGSNYDVAGLRWRRNGGEYAELSDCQDHSTCVTSQSGIYECHYQGERGLGIHSIVKVILRDCPAEMWDFSSGCDKVCVECINGGVCDDEIGDCVCPPGFHGTHCELTCGFNAVGPTCGVGCTINAGVGRTGTFIAICNMLDMMDDQQELDVHGCVQRLREQRVKVVQTLEQYEFIYNTLFDVVLCRSTSILTSNFGQHLAQLKIIDPTTKTTVIKSEYEVIGSDRASIYPS